MGKKLVLFFWVLGCMQSARALDHVGIVFDELAAERFTLIESGQAIPILIDEKDDVGVSIAARNLQSDFGKVAGTPPELLHAPAGKRLIVVGTMGSRFVRMLLDAGKIEEKALKGKREKYMMTMVEEPFDGVSEALVVAGSDKRGAIYGIYELSEQIGVSPWYDWADVPVVPKQNLSMARGVYSAGEPAVRYRGLFLNDEAPCLTGWVKHTYGTNYGDHRFYARVFELILRLRGNFLWPAMWSWSFYADDPENSRTARDMGIIMGTSHHEPMARNHQEWARHRREYGAWDYVTNQKVIDRFFREGIERAMGSEDLITIGMRGDGDAPMGGKEGEDQGAERDKANLDLLERIIRNQRRIIKDVTGRPAKETPQVWAIYKEVQKYYDMGLRVPDDVIMLLSDDNWGNVRRLPRGDERKHPGGWGMYYHVDYVGAPRNSKWLNVTPIQHIWEQLQLTYDYGVDRLWVLNVGDLKPMEYPITLFLDMAWNPKRYTAANLLEHARGFCAQQFGAEQADEAMRILNLYSKYNGRVTPEMLDARTYNVENGEWKQVSDEYRVLEADALRQYISLPEEYRDAYKQLILFPVQAMANLHEMYYAQAMNHKLYAERNPQANFWADKVAQAFRRDSLLCDDYNNVMSGGKWKNMMIQKHIGYRSWNDNFRADTMPKVFRLEHPELQKGGYVFTVRHGVVSMEAEHYFSAVPAAGTEWTVIPYLGRTLSGLALMPYTKAVEGASLTYRFSVPEEVTEVEVHVVVKSTLAFHDADGHAYAVKLGDGEEKVVNFNSDLNEEPENIYRVFYPTVARRVVEKTIKFPVTPFADGMLDLTLKPLDPGIVFEKIVVDCGGYERSYLFMEESPNERQVAE